MIAALNYDEKKAQLENGQVVPLAFFAHGKEVATLEEATSILAGPYHEWNGKRYDRKFVNVDIDAITFLDKPTN